MKHLFSMTSNNGWNSSRFSFLYASIACNYLLLNAAAQQTAVDIEYRVYPYTGNLQKKNLLTLVFNFKVMPTKAHDCSWYTCEGPFKVDRCDMFHNKNEAHLFKWGSGKI